MNKIYIICGVLLAAAVILFIFRKQAEQFLNRADIIENIKSWCIAADDYIRGSKLGQERLAYVCGKLAAVIPQPLQFFITAEKLKEAVNAVFEEIKITLEDGTTAAALK